MLFTFSCPSCQRRLRANESQVGTGVKCPSCGQKLRVPAAPAEAAAARPKPATAPPPTARVDTSAARPPAKTRPTPQPSTTAKAPGPPPRKRAEEEEDIPYAVEQVAEPEPELEPEPEPRPKKRRKSDPDSTEETYNADQFDSTVDPEYLRKRKKRKPKPPLDRMLPWMSDFALGMSVLGLMWFILVSVTFFFGKVAVVLIVLGAILAFCGRMWFRSMVREDGLQLLMLIPFFPLYYFFTNMERAAKPVLLSSVGAVFLLSGFVMTVVKHEMSWHHDYSDDGYYSSSVEDDGGDDEEPARVQPAQYRAQQDQAGTAPQYNAQGSGGQRVGAVPAGQRGTAPPNVPPRG